MTALTFHQVVNGMTNHERNLWARAKYPGLKKKDAGAVAEFCPAAARRAESKFDVTNPIDAAWMVVGRIFRRVIGRKEDKRKAQRRARRVTRLHRKH